MHRAVSHGTELLSSLNNAEAEKTCLSPTASRRFHLFIQQEALAAARRAPSVFCAPESAVVLLGASQSSRETGTSGAEYKESVLVKVDLMPFVNIGDGERKWQGEVVKGFQELDCYHLISIHSTKCIKSLKWAPLSAVWTWSCSVSWLVVLKVDQAMAAKTYLIESSSSMNMKVRWFSLCSGRDISDWFPDP